MVGFSSWLVLFCFFLHTVCVCITFSIIQSFSGKKRLEFQTQSPGQRKEPTRIQCRFQPTFRLRFSFYIREKATKVVTF